ncbi:MAG: ATP-binding protein [Actinobacteria bacterium]|nr:ATP-binding protein [Actinomycetota bacterium]
MSRAVLRLRHHRGTTAHVASIYPFSVQAASGHQGAYVGLDLLAGGAEFCWDPFEAYATGAVTNPNCWVLGEPGNGKSALVKCLLWRMAGIYGTGTDGRWFAIADPKGEYAEIARRLGLAVVRLAPGGHTRVNPLEDGPGAADEPPEQRTLRRAEMVTALAATVLDRSLTQIEDAALFAAVEHLATSPASATLADLAGLVSRPPRQVAERLRRTPAELSHDLAQLTYALDKLLSRSLRGMFDGRSTVPLRWDGPGVVLDLSAVPIDSEALPLVMVAAAGWLSQLMAGAGPKRVQVIDEAWALLANHHTARYLQTCFKLGRTYGVANLCIAHRPSDLGAQADDGTATAKIATGLLADAATKIVLRQAPDQLEAATASFALTEPERHIVGHLTRGRALWKVAGHTAVVHHMLTGAEAQMCDTDARMAGKAAPAVARAA